MKKIATVLLFIGICAASAAQKFDYSIGFDYIFANYEYDVSGEAYHDSYTLHAVRLVPEAGVLIQQNKSVFHRLRLGADFLHRMGEGADNRSLLQELICYYNAEARFANGGTLVANAGCFPRKYLEGTSYRGPFFDNDVLYNDSNLEGVLVKYSRSSRIRAELALDWMGMLGDAASPLRRERFQILTDGSWRFAGDFSLGWTGSFYHYACAPMLKNVVDNHMLYPRLEWRPFTWLDSFTLTAGGIFTYQCDRAAKTAPVFPMGLYSEQTAGKWGLSLHNRFYWGDDLMPYYSSSYAGVPYGSGLYFQDPAFHTLGAGPSWTDWLSLRYEPRIAKFLRLGAELTFQFGDNSHYDGTFFRGWQQNVRLVVDLDPVRPHPAAPSKRKHRGIKL